MMEENYELAKMAFQRITECPHRIKHLLMLTNCRDVALNIKGGSKFIWLPYEPSPLDLSVDEKCILLAEIIKRLNVNIAEVIGFVTGA